MSKTIKRNLPASVRQRLLTLSRNRQEPFHTTLVRYAIERLLYRLSVSPYADRFLLKGAMLFAIWSETLHRPTQDVDLLGYGDPDAGELQKLFREICSSNVEPDGLAFLPETVRAEPIRDQAAYSGIRITLHACLTNAHFYDVWFMSRTFVFDGPLLAAAIRNTFEHRKTDLAIELPFSEDFALLKSTQWNGFVSRHKLLVPQFNELSVVVRQFVEPPFTAARKGEGFERRWKAGAGWT